MGRSSDIGLDSKSRTILIWMCVLICVNQLGFGTLVPVIALYAEDFGVGQTAIGLTIAIFGLARLLAGMPAGRIADELGRKHVLALGGLLTVVGSILCAVAPSYVVFLLARFIAGAGAACVLTGGQIVLADIASPHNRGRVMAIYQGVFLFSVGAGAWPGGWMAKTFGLASPFWMNAMLAAGVAVLAWRFVPETRWMRTLHTAVRIAPPRISLRDQWRVLAGIPGFALICLVSFVAFFARTGGLFSVIPLLAENSIGLEPDQIGLGIGMISIVSLALVYPSGALVDRFGRKSVIVPSMALSAGAILLYASAGTFAAYMVASICWSAASGVSGAAPGAYAADIAPAGMAAPTIAMYRSLADVGYVAGPLVLGLLAELGSPQLALGVTAVMLLASGVLFAIRAPESFVRPPPFGDLPEPGGNPLVRHAMDGKHTPIEDVHSGAKT